MLIRSTLLGFVSSCLFLSACSSTTPTTGQTAANDAGTSPTDSGSSGTDAAAPAGGTSLTGTLGSLGAVQPTVASFMISNSGETLIYMSSGPLTCDQIKVSRWLQSTTAGSQVVEIVIKGAPSVGDFAVPPGEVNFAPGGKSSSYETNADSGKITFTKADPKGIVEGTVTATYGTDTITGTFKATFCDGGQGY